MGGMLEGFVYLKHLYQFLALQMTRPKICFFSDGKVLLACVNNHRGKQPMLRYSLAEDYDVECQILQVIRQLDSQGWQITINFVKGHQSINNVEATFNDKLDSLDTYQLHRHNSCLPHDNLPALVSLMEFNNIIITGSFKRVLAESHHYPPYYTYIKNKHKYNGKDMNNTWWEAMTKTTAKLSMTHRSKILKAQTDWIPTKSRAHKLD
jgi:hypothetical protein